MISFLPQNLARSWVLSCLLLLLGIAGNAKAEANEASLKIQGEWIQGGMLEGKVSAGSKVSVLGVDAVVDNGGNFVFGLGRDAPETVIVSVTKSDGTVLDTSFRVEQRQYKTQKIEGVERKYVSPPESVSERIKQDAAMVWQARQSAELLDSWKSFIWPAKGLISGVYGSQRIFNGVPKRPHYGLDIANNVGEPVVAPAGGVVTLAKKDLYYSGGTVIIAHGQGISSTFIHMSELHVELGQVVSQGDLIGEIGATGRVTGPHLDWRVNWFSQRLDPELLVPARP